MRDVFFDKSNTIYLVAEGRIPIHKCLRILEKNYIINQSPESGPLDHFYVWWTNCDAAGMEERDHDHNILYDHRFNTMVITIYEGDFLLQDDSRILEPPYYDIRWIICRKNGRPVYDFRWTGKTEIEALKAGKSIWDLEGCRK